MLQDSSHRRSTMRRLLAATLVAATLIPTSAAVAAEAAARDISSACPDGRTPTSGYRDVQTFTREVDCIHAYDLDNGITSGDRYQPTVPVTRAEMATYLANALRAAGRHRPANLPNAFSDDDRSPHRANIDWLAHEGMVKGTGDGRYLPDNLVNRAQLASYVNGLIRELTGRRLASDRDWFRDDEDSVHESNINGVAGHGLVVGTAPDTYSPMGWSTRAQMAAFLARTLAELVDRKVVEVPFGPRVMTAAPTDARTMPLSDNNDKDRRDRGQRTFTATVPISIERVTVALFPTSQVRRDQQGRLVFTSNSPIAGNLGIGVESVNGNRIDNVDRDRDRVVVDDILVDRDNTVTIVIDSIVQGSVTPVVFHDSIQPQLNVLDLPQGTSESQPREALETVAVGGATAWAPAEPARGQDLGTGTVREIDVNAGWYTLDMGGSTAAEWLVRINTSDDYTYTASREPVSGSPGPVTRTQFLTWLSVGDRVDPNAYNPGRMRHNLVGDIPLAPTQVAASSTSGVARITWTKPSNPVADDAASSFRLERTPTQGNGAGTWTEVASRSGDKTAEFTDAPPTAGTWSYRVVARSVSGNSPVSPTASVAISTSPPTSTSSRISLDNDDRGHGGANRTLDNGDRVEIVFDRAIEVLGGWSITVQDADGTRGVLDADNATPTLSNSNRTLTINVGGKDPRIVRDGSNREVDIDAPSSGSSSGFLQVVASQGIGRGTGWNLVASGLPNAPGNGSRTIIDGSGSGRRTPGAAGGTIVLVGGTSTVQFGRDEVQTIGATNATDGTYRLRIASGTWSEKLELQATAAQVQAALEALPEVGVGNVVVTGGPIASQPLVVSFTGALRGVDVLTIAVDDAQLTKPKDGWVAPVSTTTVQGAAVTNVVKGDRITLHDDQGTVLGTTDALDNGRATVSLSVVVPKGQNVFVVVEAKESGRFSTTGVLTAG